MSDISNSSIPMQILIEKFLRKTPENYKLNAFDRILMTMLASYMGVRNTCFPSIKSLIIDCGMSKNTVLRTIKRLEMLKIIHVIRVEEKNNIYTFTEQVVSVGHHLVSVGNLKVVPDRHPNNNNINNNINNRDFSKNYQKNEPKQTAKFWGEGHPDWERNYKPKV